MSAQHRSNAEWISTTAQCLATLLCWSSALVLLMQSMHLCPCDENWCCEHIATSACLQNQCYCTPTTPVDGLVIMGHCQDEYQSLDGTAFGLVVVLFTFPFLLHLIQLFMSCAFACPIYSDPPLLLNENILVV